MKEPDTISRAWSSAHYPNPKQRRDRMARRLEKEGWRICPYETEVTGKQSYTTYGFRAYRSKDVPEQF